MLATRISFMNEIAALCERLDVDVEHARHGIESDSRIGYSFIYPGSTVGAPDSGPDHYGTLSRKAALWPFKAKALTSGSELHVVSRLSCVSWRLACARAIEATLLAVGLTYT
jgi:UDPglucose 6-dehydrogenase